MSGALMRRGVAAMAAIVATGCIQENRVTGTGEVGGIQDTSVGTETSSETGSCEGCIIADACRRVGETNPLNPCEACDPARNGEAWSPILEDVTCEDDDPCTLTGVCDAGVCVAPQRDECTNPPPCVESVQCTAERCTPVVADGFCLIDGRCHADGDGADDDVCLVCDAGKEPRAWSFSDATCDDGEACTFEDRCREGACVGEENDCRDALDCTSDYCDGFCHHDLQGGWCLVQETCFLDGQGPPANSCRVCRPEIGTAQLTPEAAGTTCDDGDACSSSSACDFTGNCFGAWDAVDEEPNGTPQEARYVGNTFGDESFPSGEKDANLGSTTDRDLFKWDMLFPTDATIGPLVELKFPEVTAVELCVYARCGVTELTAPSVACEDGDARDSLNTTIVGCCRDVTTKEATMGLAATCSDVVPAPGLALVGVRALGAVDNASCGGYHFKWGAGP